MTAMKRVLTVLGLALSVVLGIGIPASAAFSDTASLGMTLRTTSVEPPGSPTGSLSCGPERATMQLSWIASSTPGVVTYRVDVHFKDGGVRSWDVPATQTSWTQEAPSAALAIDFDYSVTAITDYGWHRQSSKQGQFKC